MGVRKDPKQARKRGHLLGIGLDNQDGHKRLTQGEDFTLAGGSEETHERMTETVLKTSEELREKGKALAEADPAELAELLDKHQPR